MSGTQSAAQVLRSLRRAQGRSLRLAAEEMGLAASHLSRLERGERGCTPQVRDRLAAYYGVPADVLTLAEGGLPSDVVEILRAHPEEIQRLRNSYGQRPEAAT